MKKLLLLTVTLCMLSAASAAQSGDGRLQVSVKDQMGSSIPQAVVVLRRTGDRERQARANVQGIARFTRLPAGEYRIVVTAAGFGEKAENFTVQAGETRNVEVTLDIAPIESDVDVEQNSTIDAEKPIEDTVLNESEIANLPDDPQELERTIRRIGQAVTGEDLPISVNGVEGGKIPPKEAIQQIRVNQNVFSAQYDGPFGGGIEIFTRSGVDKFSGYAGFSFADARFNAADPFLGGRVPYQSRGYYFNVSGPLFGKKANFFAYGSRGESDSAAVVNAVIPDGDLRPVAFRQSLATPSRSENFSFNVNADPTKKHKLYMSYSLDGSRAKGQNVGGFSLPSRANDTNTQNHYIQFSDTYLMNANVVNQTRLLFYSTENNSFGGSGEPAINVLDAFFGGGSQQNSRNRNLRFDSSNQTTWQMGRYALGFGFRFRAERISQNSLSNFGGTYTFSGRLAPVLDEDDQPVLDDEGNFVTIQIDSLESYRRTLYFRQLGYDADAIRQLGGGPNQFTISGGNPELNVTQYDVGLYLQNSYKISETLAASFGIRYEDQSNIDSHTNFAPRLGLIWSPKAKDKQNPLYTLPRISIGYGLFYTRYGLNNTLNIRQASDPDRVQYLVTETDILDLFPVVPTVDLLEQFALPRTQRFIAARFDSPYQSLLNITATKKLPKGFTLNVTLSRGSNRRLSFTQNINAPLAGTFDPQDPSQAVRPFGNVGNIYESRSIGRARTDRLNVNIGFPQSQTLYASLRYSFSKTKSSVANGSGSPFDPYDFSREYGPAAYDGVHNVGGYFYYSLPFYKLSIGGDFNVSSGTRFNIFTGRDTNGDGYYSERPSFASDLTKPGLVVTPYGVLDPDPSPADELIPRNLGRGPASFVFNSSVSKRIGFNEDKANKKPPKQTLSFSIRANNVFNIINKGNPVGNMSSPNFLRTLSGFSDGGIYTINGVQQVSFPGRSLSFNVGFGF